MTNKYSGLSDAAIDYLVAEKRNRIVIDHIYRDVFIPKICSSYEDAFKLMIANDIDLVKGKLRSSKGKWLAVKSNPNDYVSGNPMICVHKNPCRAIAECFLLMKDAEKE